MKPVQYSQKPQTIKTLTLMVIYPGGFMANDSEKNIVVMFSFVQLTDSVSFFV